jgi:signal transduction histidine kinase
MRATADLRSEMQKLQDVVERLASADLPSKRLRALLSLKDEAVSTQRPPARGGIDLANAEDKIASWLDGRGVENSWDVASAFISVGLDEAWLDNAAGVLGATDLSPGLNWIAATLVSTELLDQVDDALGRIAQLVAAVKDYSYVDRAPEQDVNVHQGIDKTLLVLGYKLRPGIQIIREYDEHLPTIQANGAELNQVWTNLIDNAIDAVDGRGRIFIRTRHDDDVVIVEIADQGPGISNDLASRIFDPFFTTKQVGKGTGLGLDIVRRIVVDGHHGEIAVESIPGDTRFIVRLPVGS